MRMKMSRPVTLFTAQFSDMPFEQLCKLAKDCGYDGLELATFGNYLDIEKAAKDLKYCAALKKTLKKFGLKLWAISNHFAGQLVCDPNNDARSDCFAPAKYAGKPEEIRKWAIEYMMKVPTACENYGIGIVTGFMGSPIWKFFYSFPPTPDKMVEEGYDEIVKLWTPILDEFERKKIKFALEVHPTEIAFDYYSTRKLFEKLKYHPAFGLNFDPSHLLWQGVNPSVFLQDYIRYVYHVHLKDVGIVKDGRTGMLGSHLPFGSTERGWNFRSLGRGNVNFEEIIRILNEHHYNGPLSIEWEDNGMDRMTGLDEAVRFARSLNYCSSDLKFDATMKN